MEYRALKSYDLAEASNLIYTVFLEFVAPEFSQEGIDTFTQFIQPAELAKSLGSAGAFIIGCYDEEKLVGVAAMRDVCHISLLFVDKAYQGRGIANKLLLGLLNKCIEINPKIEEITVNSSPYAVNIYKKWGFKPTGEETIKDGIKFTPMKRVVATHNTAGLLTEVIRHIGKDELKDLLKLYKHLNKNDPELEENESLEVLWESILNDPSQHYLVTEVDGKLVSSCVLIILNNLTRSGRPYGLIENVVTHEHYRHKGYGERILRRALEIAKDKDCYKVMLMSGRGEETLKFYEKVGFERGKKTGFVMRFD